MIIEIRAAEGGRDSAEFVAELSHAYERYLVGRS
jgi:protein subunit release factor A